MSSECSHRANSPDVYPAHEIRLSDYELLKREVAEGRVLADINRIVGLSLSIDDYYVRFADQVKELVKFDRLDVHLVDAEKQEMIDAYVYGIGHEDWEPNFRHSFQSTPIQIKALSGQTISMDESDLIKAAPKAAGAKAALEAGLKSVIAVPLLSQGRALGVLSFASCVSQRYLPSEVANAERVGSSLAAAIANSLLYEQAKRIVDERKILSEAALTINSSLDIEEVYHTFTNQLKDLIGFDRLVVSTLSDDRSVSTTRHVSGIGSEDYPSGYVVLLSPAVQATVKRVVNSRLGLRVTETSPQRLCGELGYGGELKIPVEKYGFTSVVTCPLISRGKVFGMVFAWSTQQPGYTDHDLQNIHEISPHISSALANAWNYEDTQRDARERKVLANAGLAINSSLDMEEVYQVFASQLKDLIGFDRLGISTISSDQETSTIRHVSGVGAEEFHAGRVLPVQAVAVEMIINRHDLNIAETTPQRLCEKLGYEGELKDAVEKFGFTSLLAINLVSRDRVIGIVTAWSTRQPGYSEHDLQLLQEISPHVASAMVNSQLLQQSQRHVHERKILADAALALNSSLDIEEVYQNFASHLKDLIGFDRLGITTLSDDHLESTIRYISGAGTEDYHAGRVVPVLPIAVDMINDRHDLRIAETTPHRLCEKLGYEGEMKFWVEKLGFTSLVATNLISRDEVIGMVTAWSARQPGYLEHDLHLIQEISPHIASAMANSDLYEESQRSIVEREILAQASSILHQTLELDEVYAEFADYIHRLIGYDRIDVSTLSGNPLASTIRHVAGEAAEEFPPGRSMPISPVMAKIIETGAAELFNFASPNKLSDASGHGVDLRPVIERYGVTSQLSAPLFVRGEVTGAVNTYSSSSPGYSERDLRLLEEVATYISSAMANSERDLRLLEEVAAHISSAMANSELCRATQREASERALVADIGAAVNSNLDLDTIFERVADGLEKIIQFDRLNINLIDPEDSEINWIAYERGLRRPDVVLGERFRSRIFGELVDKYIDDISREGPPRESWPVELGLRSVMIVKLHGKEGIPIGMISVRSKNVGEYDDLDLELLKLIAFQVTPAIKNAQILTQIGELAQREERSRISRDMHDSVSLGLSSLLWQLDALAGSLDAPLDDRKRLLEGARQAAAFSLIETRNAIRNLRPEQLSNFGLQDAIKQEIERLIAPARIEHTYVVNGTAASFAPMIELTVLRVCQEAVANAVRHAQAAKIEVRLDYGQDALELQISDDGRGFDTESVLSTGNSGSGLSNLIERSQEVSGNLEVNSSPSHGTIIRLTVRGDDLADSDPEPGD